MNYLKQGGKIGIFFIACAITFGFSSSVVFSAAPTTEAECKALPGGNCQKEGAVYNCESGETEYGSCGGANPVCCVTKETCGSNNQGACRYTIAGGCKSDESVLTNCSTNWSGQERKCCVPNTSGTPNSDTSCTSSCNGATCKARKAISTVGSTPCPTGFKENGTCNSKNSGEQVCCIPSSCTPSTTSSTTSSGSGSTSSSGSASLKYTPLENLPGFENQGGDFATYFGNLYKLALWIVGISALFMLVVGGFLYLSSAGNTALLGTAKKTIYSALIGLVIALVSWLLLDTINSDLTNLKLSGLSGAISSGSSGGTTGTGSGTVVVGSGSGCGGAETQSGAHCEDAAQAVSDMLKCMVDKLGSKKMQISSISEDSGGSSLFTRCRDNYSKPPCEHTANSCHYGGSGKASKSCAADISNSYTSNSGAASKDEIKAAARSCGAPFVNDEGNHVHISVSGCSCDGHS